VRLLVTRPEEEAERTAAMLRARGHAVVVAPLLRIAFIGEADVGARPWAAILVTSANAAGAVAAHGSFAVLRALPVFAVGERSAAAMRGVGFGDVTSAAGDVYDLARLAAARVKSGLPLLYLAGADRAGDLAGALAAHDLPAVTCVIYRAVAADALPRNAITALGEGVDGVLHYSRRSAETYVKAASSAGLTAPALARPAHFCLSAQVAEPLAQAGAPDVRVAAEPNEAALIRLIPSP
jgi:uroporphyrinogen-III synthase